MTKNYLKAFDVEHSEQGSVFLLLCLSVFLGIFAGSFDIGASSLFLDAFPYSMLPKAILVSGLTGILITTVYSKLQTMIPFSRLVVYNLLFVLVTTVLLRIGYEISSAKWLAFLAFVLLGPLNIISIVGFWGLATRMFNLRQGKRLFGIVDTGQVVGIVLSTFAIPLLLTFGFQIKNLLLVSSISALGAVVVLSFIVRKYNIDANTSADSNEKQTSSVRFFDLFKQKYTLYIVLFVSLSMITAFFIFNSFLSVSKVKYPDSNDFAKFLGLFTGTVMIFSIIIKTFVYSNLLKTYGLKSGLLLTPLLLGGLTIIASVVGSFGYTSESKMFIFFFLMVTLSRLLSVSLRVSIESPSSKLLYQCLDEKIRHDVQAKIDGVVNESAALLSGIILAILGSLSFIKLNHLTYILFIFVGAWIVVSWKLYNAYRKSLEDNLHKSKRTESEKESSFKIHETLIQKAIHPIENDNTQLNALLVLQALSPFEFEKSFPELLQKGTLPIRDFALRFIEEQKVLEYIPNVIESKIELQAIQKNSFQLISQEAASLSKQEILISYLKSRDKDKRIFAARYMGMNPDSIKNISTFTALLHDADIEVKASALIAASQLKNIDLVPIFAEYLDHPALGNIAYEALLMQRLAVIDSLEQYYYKTGISVQTQLQIVKLLGEVCDAKSLLLLTNKINSSNIRLLNQVVLSLLKCNYHFSETHRIEFNNAIQLVLSVIAWNLSILLSSENKALPASIILAIEDGIKRNYDLLYNIISLVYDSDSVKHVRQNIETGTTESIGYALELMDIFIDDELKPLLIPFFEDGSLSDKVKNLQNFFPICEMNSKELLLSVINKDYNHIGLWTKTCAIMAYSTIDDDISDDLVSLLFHPDKIIHETAAFVINNKSQTKISTVNDRIQPTIRKSIDDSILKIKKNKFYFNYEKILFLKNHSLFNHFQGEDILPLAKSVQLLTHESQSTITNNKEKEGLYFVISGNLLIHHSDETIHVPANDFIDTTAINMNQATIEITENTLVYFLPRMFFNKFLFDHQDSADILLIVNTTHNYSNTIRK